ncbi:hypothetical protein Osc7112_1662 [Oscillatoria nigro-viridis PCC 7112]|uniref:Uncharacterized protein n=1 Tax=Phormidium nigroviride PCC 7112 TaxID=179408 RepID=K9VFZ7_9CYAN|nr:hypothetical protein Osc7112_1662 [Oscillatoria nigro-viridis PCC 7112]
MRHEAYTLTARLVLGISLDSPGLSAIEMSARAKLSHCAWEPVAVGYRRTSAPP